MNHILLPDSAPRRLVFYLAMEEWVAGNLSQGFFYWQVPPTVIFGRNQDIYSELDLEYCRNNNIEFYRRKSGGGCVYSDMGNLMISCIMPQTNVQKSFDTYLSKLSAVLSSLGFDAVKTSNNDILIEERKVSGNALFSCGNSTIVHGTLLYDTDFSIMQKAITPSVEKLAKHSVKSVRQRVVNIKELNPTLELSTIKNQIKAAFSDSEYCLTPKEISQIEDMEASYLQASFIFGKDAY